MRYRHKEAYCLMWYQCDGCQHRERIWNSRDGATPFGMECPSCGMYYLMHTDFHLDQCIPNYKLNLYQRFWRDGTDEEAIAFLNRRWEHMNADPYLDVGRYYGNHEEFIQKILNDPDGEFQPGWPKIDICKEA